MSSYELSLRAPRARGLPALRLGGLGVLACVCVAFGLLTLLTPSSPTYDPFAWLIWGRQIVHLHLDTQFGPSWKPLPVLFTTAFGLVPSAAPYLWVAVARAGGLAAILLAFRVARRLGGGWAGGLVAAASLAVCSNFVRFAGLGDSEGLLVAFLLAGIELHLTGRRHAALWAGFFACLLRPEAWPFAALYGLWLAREDRAARRLVVGMAIIGASLWFLPELWGSGNALRAGTRARTPVPGSAAFAHHPLWAVFRNFRAALPWPAEIGTVAVLAAAALRRVRTHAPWIVAVAGIAWMLIVGVMAEAGFTGNVRYLMPAAGLVCVAAGAAWGRAFAYVPKVGAPLALLAAGALLWSPAGQIRTELRQVRGQGRVNERLGDAVSAAGGSAAVLRCGAVTVGPYEVTALAWRLGVPIRRVQYVPAKPGTVFTRAPRSTDRGVPRIAGLAPGWRQVAIAGPWQVLQSCGAPDG